MGLLYRYCCAIVGMYKTLQGKDPQDNTICPNLVMWHCPEDLQFALEVLIHTVNSLYNDCLGPQVLVVLMLNILRLLLYKVLSH